MVSLGGVFLMEKVIHVFRCVRHTHKASGLKLLTVFFRITPGFFVSHRIVLALEPWLASLFDEEIRFVTIINNNNGIQFKYTSMNGCWFRVIMSGGNSDTSNRIVFYSHDEDVLNHILERITSKLPLDTEDRFVEYGEEVETQIEIFDATDMAQVLGA